MRFSERRDLMFPPFPPFNQEKEGKRNRKMASNLDALENEWRSVRRGLQQNISRVDRRDRELMRDSGVIRNQILTGDWHALRRERADLLARRWAAGRQPVRPVNSYWTDDAFRIRQRPTYVDDEYYYDREPRLQRERWSTTALEDAARFSSDRSLSLSSLSPSSVSLSSETKGNEDMLISEAHKKAEERKEKADAAQKALSRAQEREQALGLASDAVREASIKERAAATEAYQANEEAKRAADSLARAAEAEAVARVREAEQVAVVARRRADSLRFKARLPRQVLTIPPSSYYSSTFDTEPVQEVYIAQRTPWHRSMGSVNSLDRDLLLTADNIPSPQNEYAFEEGMIYD